MTRSYHMCLDIRGALLNWKNRDFRTLFKHDDGRRMTAAEARLALMEELAKGRKVIPCGECSNFDYQTGCQGHETQEGSVPE